MRIKSAALVGLAMVSWACTTGSGSLLGPTRETAKIAIVDGLTGQPITSGGTVSYKNGTVTLENGAAQLEKVSAGDKLSISGVAGYRDRTTSYCGASTPAIALWRNQSGDVDEAMTEAMAYQHDGVLRRPEALFLVLSDEVRGDPEAAGAHERAVAMVTDAIQGKTRIAVAASPTSGGATIQVFVNRGVGTSGLTTGEFIGGKIVAGKIEYQDMRWARDVRVVAHEIIHALGGRHNPYPGLMNAYATGAELTPAERNLLLLRYTRPAGAVFHGDNDEMIGCK